MDTKNLLIRLDSKLHENIRARAYKDNVSMAEIVRLAVVRYLSKKVKNN